MIQANSANRLVRPLAELMLLSWGPAQVIAEEFENLPSAERVLIFGSWAARYLERPGPAPNDLDVLVVGHPDRSAVYGSAYVLAYDAARFACIVLLAQQDLRATTRGGHYAVERAVRAQFGDGFRPFADLRRRRNELEYPRLPADSATAQEATQAVDDAKKLITAAYALIGAKPITAAAVRKKALTRHGPGMAAGQTSPKSGTCGVGRLGGLTGWPQVPRPVITRGFGVPCCCPWRLSCRAVRLAGAARATPFNYNKVGTKTQTSGLGLGISGYGIDAGYNTAGSNISTARAEEDYPKQTKNTWFRTQFNTAQYRGMCHGGPGDNSVKQEKQHGYCPRVWEPVHSLKYYTRKCYWMVRSAGWFGAADWTHPKPISKTAGKFCGIQRKGAQFQTANEKAVQWSAGFDIGASDKIKDVTLKVSFSSSSQTGYDTDAQMQFKLARTGYICGTNKDPSNAAILVMRGSKS